MSILKIIRTKDSLLIYKVLKITTKVSYHVAVYLSSQLHNTNPALQKGPLEFLEEFLLSVLMELVIQSEVLPTRDQRTGKLELLTGDSSDGDYHVLDLYILNPLSLCS